MTTDSVKYKISITVMIVENGLIVKEGNHESCVSRMWVAKTKQELADIIAIIAEKYELPIK